MSGGPLNIFQFPTGLVHLLTLSQAIMLSRAFVSALLFRITLFLSQAPPWPSVGLQGLCPDPGF